MQETLRVRTRRKLFPEGAWPGIALVECDGPREREVVLDVRV